MFAIAFYDRCRRRLTLIRDRLGKKPLYVGRTGDTLFFGSQPKSFYQHPDWSPEIDRKSVAALMRFGFIPAPRSIYNGIETLRPAERVDIVDGKVVARKLYWNIRANAAAAQRDPYDLSDAEAVAELEALLSESTRLRMISDVPLGAFLSGGIDSSAIVAMMKIHSTRPVKTFSIGFDEAAHDESRHAAAVAAHLGTEHHELVVKPADALATIPLIPDIFDEPFADASQVPTYLLCKLAREDVEVVLTGDGGDELFAGYTRYTIANEVLAGTRRIPDTMRPLVIAALRRTPDAVWRMIQPLVPRRFGQSPLAERAKMLAEQIRLRRRRAFVPKSRWPVARARTPGKRGPIRGCLDLDRGAQK